MIMIEVMKMSRVGGMDQAFRIDARAGERTKLGLGLVKKGWKRTKFFGFYHPDQCLA